MRALELLFLTFLNLQINSAIRWSDSAALPPFPQIKIFLLLFKTSIILVARLKT